MLWQSFYIYLLVLLNRRGSWRSLSAGIRWHQVCKTNNYWKHGSVNCKLRGETSMDTLSTIFRLIIILKVHVLYTGFYCCILFIHTNCQHLCSQCVYVSIRNRTKIMADLAKHEQLAAEVSTNNKGTQEKLKWVTTTALSQSHPIRLCFKILNLPLEIVSAVYTIVHS